MMSLFHIQRGTCWNYLSMARRVSFDLMTSSNTTTTARYQVGCHRCYCVASSSSSSFQQALLSLQLKSTPTNNRFVMLYESRSSISSSSTMSSSTTSPTFDDFSNTNATSSTPSDDVGDYYYQKALATIAKADQRQAEEEQRRAEELYQAWKRTQTTTASSSSKKSLRSEGVAVIRTIAKQARREHQLDDDHDNEESTTVKHKAHDGHDHDHNKHGSSVDNADFARQAYELLQKAAQHGHVEAMIRLGNQALKHAEQQYAASLEQQQKSSLSSSLSPTIQESIQQALEWYRNAGEHGSAVAWFNLGHLLWVGFPAQDEDDNNDRTQNSEDDDAVLLTPDRESAMQAFTKAIDLGDLDAVYFVGVHHLSSSSSSSSSSSGSDNHTDNKNIDEEDEVHLSPQQQYGLDLVDKAAQSGHGGAKYYMALYYRNTPGSTDPTFVQRLNDAVEAGDVNALYLRGHCYYHGEDGYPQDYKKACYDFCQAAELGHADAAISAGAMLHQGIPGGVLPPDQRRAFDLYQRAGELGHVEGWRNVAACYALGEGVPQSMETAKYIIKTMLSNNNNDQTTARSK